ncbi:MAG: MerR family transcriptional regulator [Saprospiraceae bacterium]|nr:MerR family transcriptional regulator [Saprospiraceae bacterium]
MRKDEEEDQLKLYYSIGEVAEKFKVSKSLIRFWEKEFDLLKPHKNSKGERRFTKENLEQLRLIYHLVKERGFTLEGAKREIRQQRALLKQKQQMIEKLKRLRNFLKEIRNTL